MPIPELLVPTGFPIFKIGTKDSLHFPPKSHSSIGSDQANLNRVARMLDPPFSPCDPCVARNLQIPRETLKKHLRGGKIRTTISGA
ncbi:Hypothetical protein HEAR2778 [Herminiimonas arsenicoxydans]|uniref:Uncharacterized protein n=1 Tax=Herminiimonas arsenicoxydans TaxID=204773 RepID=A4G8Q7_HERAR|nr:Hypothetical protein HEAR2778 [Herminiimonas arsenicoxydans]